MDSSYHGTAVQCSLPVEYGRPTMSTDLYFFVNLQNSNIGPWAKKRTCFTGYFIPKLHYLTYKPMGLYARNYGTHCSVIYMQLVCQSCCTLYCGQGRRKQFWIGPVVSVPFIQSVYNMVGTHDLHSSEHMLVAKMLVR